MERFKGDLLCLTMNTQNAPSSQWRHNEGDGVSNNQPHDCLRSRLFRRRSVRTSKLRVASLCEGNSPVTGEFPAKRASNTENLSIWWRHHDFSGTNNLYKWRSALMQDTSHRNTQELYFNFHYNQLWGQITSVKQLHMGDNPNHQYTYGCPSVIGVPWRVRVTWMPHTQQTITRTVRSISWDVIGM